MKFLFDLQQAESKLVADQRKPEAIQPFDEMVLDGLRLFQKYSTTKTISDLSDFLLLEFCRVLQLTAAMSADDFANKSTAELIASYSTNAPHLCEIGDPATSTSLLLPNVFCVDTRSIGLTFSASVEKLLETHSYNKNKLVENYGFDNVMVELFLDNLLFDGVGKLSDSMALVPPGRNTFYQI